MLGDQKRFLTQEKRGLKQGGGENNRTREVGKQKGQNGREGQEGAGGWEENAPKRSLWEDTTKGPAVL